MEGLDEILRNVVYERKVKIIREKRILSYEPLIDFETTLWREIRRTEGEKNGRFTDGSPGLS